MNETQSPEQYGLTARHWHTLRAIADVIVPPSEAYDVPGGGDERICEEVLKDAGARLSTLTEALDALEAFTADGDAVDFRALGEAECERVGLAFKGQHPTHAQRLALWVTQCYYRDDRVLRSLGLEARAPFPQGYEVDAGDWSDLDPVRTRAPLYRDTD